MEATAVAARVVAVAVVAMVGLDNSCCLPDSSCLVDKCSIAQAPADSQPCTNPLRK